MGQYHPWMLHVSIILGIQRGYKVLGWDVLCLLKLYSEIQVPPKLQAEWLGGALSALLFQMKSKEIRKPLLTTYKDSEIAIYSQAMRVLIRNCFAVILFSDFPNSGSLKNKILLT